MSAAASAQAFACGHPRTPENSYLAPSAATYAACSLCRRVRAICIAVLRDQARINAGEPLRRCGGNRRYRYG